MTEVHRIAIWIPLLIGLGVVVCTLLIHAGAIIATVNLVRHEVKVGHTGMNFWDDLRIATVALSFTLVAHLIEIAVWAVLFVYCKEFSEFGTAYYHSAVNYTTLGYGDLIMTPSWRLLGPIEAADGMLMFGVSTAIVFTVIQHLVQARFADLPH